MFIEEVKKQQVIYNDNTITNWKVLTAKVKGDYYPSPRKQHPDVINKKAFWQDNKTLIVGYSLIDNPDIFRPIWQSANERMKYKMRNDIRRYAKFTAAVFREELVRKTLMKDKAFIAIPKDIIDIIARYTYDPLLYIFKF